MTQACTCQLYSLNLQHQGFNATYCALGLACRSARTLRRPPKITSPVADRVVFRPLVSRLTRPHIDCSTAFNEMKCRAALKLSVRVWLCSAGRACSISPPHPHENANGELAVYHLSMNASPFIFRGLPLCSHRTPRQYSGVRTVRRGCLLDSFLALNAITVVVALGVAAAQALVLAYHPDLTRERYSTRAG